MVDRGKGSLNALDPIALVIFDCDGVLIDSEPIASRTLAEMLRRESIDITDAESHLRFTGNSVGVIKTMCERDYGLADADRVFAEWDDYLFEEFARSLRPMTGIEAFVRALSRPICVASNSSSLRLRRSLGLLDLWHAFGDAVFSADMVARPKPEPDLLLHCAAEFDASPAACVMIDDNPHGVAAARTAGMVAVGFIDPADQRPQRERLLVEAGAVSIAVGAAGLAEALAKAAAVIAVKDPVG